VNPLRKWLAGGPLITDGAWGTELQARGLEPGAAPDTWNLAHPDPWKMWRAPMWRRAAR
jgi:5-methyltetrahydrofolate--homocysteine methyltransferase